MSHSIKPLVSVLLCTAMACAGSALGAGPKAATPALSLGDLHSVMVDAFNAASSRSHTLPSLTLNAPNLLQTFPAPELLTIPDGILGGTTGKDFIPGRIRFLAQNGTGIICYYKPDTGQFDYCARHMWEADCNANPDSCLANPPVYKGVHYKVNTGLAAGDTILTRSVQVLPAACPTKAPCSVPEPSTVTFPNANPACGGLALSSVYFLEDVACAGPAPIALTVIGDNALVRGQQHSILAPKSQVGLFLSGHNMIVKSLNLSNIPGYGALAYNTDALLFFSNVVQHNIVGLDVYADQENTTKIRIRNNDFSGSAYQGLVFNGDGKQTTDPLIYRNNFSNTGDFAIDIDAAHAVFSGAWQNIFTGANGALSLSNGTFAVANLDLSHTAATGPQIYVVDAASIAVSNVILTYPASSLASGSRAALHLYRTGKISVNNLTMKNGDVGIKATTEQGVSPILTVANSQINQASTAAVMLQSWDATPFGRVVIKGNDLRGAPEGNSVWQVNGVNLGAGSVISGNQQ